MPNLLLLASHPIPDLALVHWIHVAVDTSMYILDSRPDLIHSVHQDVFFVHNPGPAHVKGLDHILRYLTGTDNCCLLIQVGHWTSVDHQFLAGLHSNPDASQKYVELDFSGITGFGIYVFGTLLLLDLLVRIRCLPRRVKQSIILILLLSKILSMSDFYSVILGFS